jgi:DNA mismatch repair protein MutS2
VDSFTLNKIQFGELRRVLSGYCCCSLGRELALRISPSRHPDTIRRWLNQVSQMVAASCDFGLPPFGGLTDIAGPLERAKPGGSATGEDYAAIASALEACANIKNYLTGLDERYDLLRELSAGLGDFDSEVSAIRSIVGPDGAVMDSASVRLAEFRSRIQSTTRQIHDAIYGYLRDSEVAKLLQHATVTLHGDRYVLPVKAEYRGRLRGVVHRESNTGATVFVEPDQSVELNNQLSDLYEDERNEVRRLLSLLAIRVSGRAAEIQSTLRMLAQIDLISAKAQYSFQNKMTAPEIIERGPLRLSQARHPLLIERFKHDSQAVREPGRPGEVVPIDVRLGQDFDVLVITGSNTGGKTVTLKTVAMLVLMAQSGMHISAGRGSVIPIFHDIFIDVGDEQSLEQSLSTFGAHIKRVNYILSKADRNSMVLLDELGSGTDPDEGGAIGQAVLDELRRVGCLCMVTTHLSVLKAYAFSNDRVDNASVEFDTATLSPTYQLLIGRPGESHAITVAQKLGMPGRVVNSARGHLGTAGKQFRKAISATNAVRASAEVARAQAQAAAVQAKSQQEVYESKLADLHRLQEEFENWLARLSEMKSGEEMYIPSMKKTGHLVRLELHRQIALIDADNVQVEVPLSELMPDLGQAAVREQIATMRQQIMQQAQATAEANQQARRIQDEYHHSLQQQKERARQFDHWLGAIARMKVGDTIAISHKPGKGTLTKVDLPGLRVTVHVVGMDKSQDQDIELPLSELFPQTGPFARISESFRQQRRPGLQSQPQPGRQQVQSQNAAGPGEAENNDADEVQDNRPMSRRDAQSRAVKVSRHALMDAKPGQQVFVVPFNKRATLIRILPEKDRAIVQSGIFEMQLPLADLEPLRDQQQAGPPADKKTKQKKESPKGQPG